MALGTTGTEVEVSQKKKITGSLPVLHPLITNGSKGSPKPRLGLSPQEEAEGLLGFNGFSLNGGHSVCLGHLPSCQVLG